MVMFKGGILALALALLSALGTAQPIDDDQTQARRQVAPAPAGSPCTPMGPTSNCLGGSCGVYSGNPNPVCCPTARTVLFNNWIHCADIADGSICHSDTFCTAGSFCNMSLHEAQSAGRCAQVRLNVGDRCTTVGSNSQCISGGCGVYVNQPNPVCCPTVKTANHNGWTVCADLQDGAVCQSNAFCASGFCDMSLHTDADKGKCAPLKKPAGAACTKGQHSQCQSGGCGVYSGNPNYQCCQTSSVVPTNDGYWDYCGNLEVGGKCDKDAMCTRGLFCNAGQCGYKVCRTDADCNPGITCDVFLGHCGPALGLVGAKCGHDSGCLSDFCDWERAQQDTNEGTDYSGTCSNSKMRVGEPCQTHLNCRPGSSCEGGVCKVQRCEAYGADGLCQRCTTPYYPINGGKQCAIASDLLGKGAVCQTDDQCASDACDGSVVWYGSRCVDKLPIGAYCGGRYYSASCSPGARCQDDVCKVVGCGTYGPDGLCQWCAPPRVVASGGKRCSIPNCKTYDVDRNCIGCNAGFQLSAPPGFVPACQAV